MTPVYVEPFLGAGATWLRLLGPHLVPLVSWMGGKRRDADDHLALLDLRPGVPVPSLLGDACWWGWVWPTVLDPVEGPEVSAMLRFWRGRDPRALWFWLRDVGPMPSRVEAAAQLLWLQARAASGVPVWWEGVAAVQWASTKIDRAGQRNATEPRLVATTHGDGQPPGAPYDAGCKGPALLASDGRGDRLVQWSEDGSTGPNAGKGYHGGGEGGNRGGGIVDPGTIADRADAIRAALVRASGSTTTIRHTDALTLTREWASVLGPRARVYLDPPYQGATGYPATCSRETVLLVAETWARAGARVVLSEAVGLASELGPGWGEQRLRCGKRAEWVTTYGCDEAATLPPLLRAVAR